MSEEVERWSAIEARLALLEDRAAIEAVMVAYMAGCDRPAEKGKHVAACFTDEGRWESVGRHGNPDWTAVGRTAIEVKFDRNTERMPFSAHFLTNGAVTVEGDRARGEWIYFQSATYRDGRALWIAGAYDNRFERTPQGWRIAHLRVSNFFTTPYDKGWGELAHMETP